MSKVRTAFRLMKTPGKLIAPLAEMGFFNWLPDKPYLKLVYRGELSKSLNLNDPQTYNEKLQWLKLYDRKAFYRTLVDKYKVKKYVSRIIGEEYIIPTIGIWNKVEDIPFHKLPKQYVLKCTHDSGSIVVCKDNEHFDIAEACKKLKQHLNKSIFLSGREWPYKGLKPRIIAEKYMEDRETGELRDYKFFCFDGVVKAMFIASNRQSVDNPTAFDFFDENFNHLDIRQGHPNAPIPPKKPQNFYLMKELAAKLSHGIPHVRIDFYEVGEKVYFGEMTFFHYSGIVPFDPPEWDYVFGNWIQLPEKSK